MVKAAHSVMHGYSKVKPSIVLDFQIYSEIFARACQVETTLSGFKEMD